MTHYSLSEIRALCIKAARGAGFSWGLAEEAGAIAFWLESQGLQGATAIARYLTVATQEKLRLPNSKSPSWAWDDGYVCGLQAASYLSDLGVIALEDGGKSVDKITMPVLMIPACQRISNMCGEAICVNWQGATFLIESNKIVHGGSSIYTPKISQVQISLGRENFQADLARHIVPPPVVDWDLLFKLESKTYVPESERSRQSGAGEAASS